MLPCWQWWFAYKIPFVGSQQWQFHNLQRILQWRTGTYTAHKMNLNSTVTWKSNWAKPKPETWTPESQTWTRLSFHGQAIEAALLGLASLALTLANILCIVLTGIAILRWAFPLWRFGYSYNSEENKFFTFGLICKRTQSCNKLTIFIEGCMHAVENGRKPFDCVRLQVEGGDAR